MQSRARSQCPRGVYQHCEFADIPRVPANRLLQSLARHGSQTQPVSLVLGQNSISPPGSIERATWEPSAIAELERLQARRKEDLQLSRFCETKPIIPLF